MVSKAEWEAIKALYRYRCAICRKTEREVGTLEKAHIKAASRGGTQIVPMCPNHHKMYNSGKLPSIQLKKLGLSKKQAAKLIPSKHKKQDYDFFGF